MTRVGQTDSLRQPMTPSIDLLIRSLVGLLVSSLFGAGVSVTAYWGGRGRMVPVAGALTMACLTLAGVACLALGITALATP